jgi:HopA1 effector protein family
MLEIRSRQLTTALEDITSNVMIQSNFWITHPNYPALEVDATVFNSLQQLSVADQHDYISLQLQNFLYQIYFNGARTANLTIDLNPDCRELVNNTASGLNIEFLTRLRSSNCGKGYFDPGWQVQTEVEDRILAVKKNNLTLHIDRDRHLQLVDLFATCGDTVAIKMPSNLMDDGFYIAVGNAGKIASDTATEIYFNISPEGAIVLMSVITQQLNQLAMPFTFKVLYDPADYDYLDAGILRFDRDHYMVIRDILEPIYREHRACFQPSVPLFTKLLAPGLSLAESPHNPEFDQENFGKHRCQIVADALLTAWQQGDESSAHRMSAINQFFAESKVDWERPYLNPNGQDIYEFISNTQDINQGVNQ